MLRTQEISDLDYQRFKRFLEEACGILLGDGKQYLLISRLTRLMRDEQIANVSELLTTIERGFPRHIRDAVIDAMTTNETSWFRDGQPFETFANVVLPELESQMRMGCKIWSSACSSGQEPYTISMVLSEYLRKVPVSKLTASQIMATDISASVLAQAKRGVYENIALTRGLTENRKRQFFTAEGDCWKINDEVKNRVSFREQNLLQSFSSLGRFDVIFCRNVLIYFSAERKRDILSRMAQALNPGGYLFLGASETITGYTEAFELIRSAYGSYYRKKS